MSLFPFFCRLLDDFIVLLPAALRTATNRDNIIDLFFIRVTTSYDDDKKVRLLRDIDIYGNKAQLFAIPIARVVRTVSTSARAMR